MTWSCKSGRAGFTLLEVLVALAIAGIALAAMTDAATGGFLATKTATGYQEALSRARSHLSALASDAVFTVGDAEGEDGGGFRWRSSVREKERQAAGNLALFDISVAVSWSSGGRAHRVALTTLRLGRAAAGRHE
jgi:general secretion pathway protein I